MHDHSGLATPSSGHPGYVFQGVGSPMRQGGEAGMKPREGKHATNPSGFSGVGISPPARGSFISGRPLGPLSFTLQVRGRRCPRSGGGLCLLPQVAPPVSPKRGTPGLLSRPRRLHPAEPLGSHAPLGPRAVQAPGLRSQGAVRFTSCRSLTPWTAARSLTPVSVTSQRGQLPRCKALRRGDRTSTVASCPSQASCSATLAPRRLGQSGFSRLPQPPHRRSLE